MKQGLLTLTILLLFSLKSFCQFTDSDMTITTKGLSEEYAARFKDSENKAALVSVLNQLSITHNIAPIKIIVTYENGAGDVTAEINYNHEKIFANYDYNSHNRKWSRWGTGISVYLQHQIFAALSQYKKSVATKGYLMDKDLLKFESTVKCKKSNGDFVNFYTYNYLNSQGFYPYIFYKNAHISIAGKIYETKTSNTKTLNDLKFFMVGKTTGLDGGKTGAYYFCDFFYIETETTLKTEQERITKKETAKYLDNSNYPNPIPTDIKATIKKCNQLYFEGKFKECALNYDTLCLKYPDYSAGFYNRGLARFNYGDKVGAKQDFEKATSLNMLETK